MRQATKRRINLLCQTDLRNSKLCCQSLKTKVLSLASFPTTGKRHQSITPSCGKATIITTRAVKTRAIGNLSVNSIFCVRVTRTTYYSFDTPAKYVALAGPTSSRHTIPGCQTTRSHLIAANDGKLIGHLIAHAMDASIIRGATMSDNDLTMTQAAQLCGYVNKTAIWYHIKAGHLPARRIGHMWVIDRADLAAWQASRTERRGRPRKGEGDENS